ncbi:unnamed protein product [Anisakis simplex]|uniref:Peptidase_M13 domain-containing protein n=1 Tax=Anisakis simplex TaxID=6269 RepID=A0A0M3JPQ9_ANISI|nr:unnamed protein product [Anisakis simplex]
MYRWFEIHSKYFDRDAQNLLNGMACTTNPERLNRSFCWLR